MHPLAVSMLCISVGIGIRACSLAFRSSGEQARIPRESEGLPEDASQRTGLTTLAGALAHELSQPLTAITSNAHAARELLASNMLEQKLLREILDDIVDDASRASDIVRAVRALVLGEAPHMRPFSVGDMTDQAVELAGANARSRCVVIQRDLAEPLPRAMGDPVEIRLVLLNLLANALDAVANGCSTDDRSIVIRVKAGDGTLCIAVQDNGCGVAKDDLSRIFRPFYSSKPRGMGLGLSLSRALMERNGGRLKANCNSGRGMTFEFELLQERTHVVMGS